MRNAFQILTLLACALPAAGQSLPVAGQWSNIGPEGGSVGFMTFDPQTPATVYAATGVGLFKSSDSGATWANTGLMGFSVGKLILDPRRAAILYAIAALQNLDDVLFKLYKSTDSGVTWTDTRANLPVNDVAIDPRNSDTLYASLGDTSSGPAGIFKSTDGGATWIAVNSGPDTLFPYPLAIDPNGVVYVAGFLKSTQGAAIFKSTDGGASWGESDVGLPGNLGAFPSGIAIDPQNPATLYLNTPFGIFKSTDAGASWNGASAGLLPVNANSSDICCFPPVLIDPQNPSTLYEADATGIIYKSTNGGASWNAVHSPLGSGARLPMAIDPLDSNTLLEGTVGGVFKSTDGGATWRISNSGLRAMRGFSIAFDPQTPSALYAAATGGAFRSSDAGRTWGVISSGIKLDSWAFWVVALAVDPLTPTKLYAGTSGPECGYGAGGIYRSVDGAASWIDTGLVSCMGALVVDPQNPSTVYAATHLRGVVKSTDSGATWADASTGLQADPASLSAYVPYLSALAVDPRNSRTLYAGVEFWLDCPSCPSAGLFQSTDGAGSWKALRLDLGNSYVSALAIDPQNPATVYAATANGGGTLWKSSDAGATWQKLLALDSGIFAVALDPQNTGTLFVGGDSGVLKSADGGQSWAAVPGSPAFVDILAFDPWSSGTLYAGGESGLFALKMP